MADRCRLEWTDYQSRNASHYYNGTDPDIAKEIDKGERWLITGLHMCELRETKS